MATITPTSFYVIGGTLQRNAPSYVPRQADEDLYNGLTEGKFCYVLTSRQMGKSSLMVRTAARLREEGAAVAVLDLTAIGQNLTAEQWYDGLLSRIGQQLDLEDELENFWLDHERLGALQRWMRAMREIVLVRYTGRVVIFVDEIDAVRSLPFSTDEFFAGIREFYNRRTQDPELARLTFCLLGVATPSDLIRDARTTPFNIGQRIELSDFDEREANPLAEGLGRGAKRLKRVLYWTGGHPYLTQRLCQAVAEDASVASPNGVDKHCEELFLSLRARERDDNLLFVRERILRSDSDRAGLLDLFARVQQKKRVRDDETNPLLGILRLSGIIRIAGGRLHVRNLIYERVFDRSWIINNMPDAELRRQRAAFRKGALRAGAVATVMLSLMAGLAILAVKGRNRAVEEARRADRNAQDREKALVDLRAALAETRSERENADKQKQIAEQQQQIAEQERAEAERQQRFAQEKSQQAVEQQLIAAKGKREAEEAKGRALVAQRTAEDQRLLATERAAEAEKQRRRAEEQTKLATSTLFKGIRFLEESNDKQNDKQRVVEYYHQLAQIYHEVGDRSNEVETLLTVGGIYLKLKEEEKADEYFNRALKVFRDVGEATEAGNTMTKVGDLYNTSGNKQKANSYYNQALALLQRVLPGLRAGADRKREAYALYYTSLTYQALGDAQKALDFSNQALPLFQALHDAVMTDIVGIRIEELSQSLKERK